MNDAPKNGAGYERSDAKLKPLVIFSIVLAALVVVALWIVAALESGFERAREAENPQHPLRELRQPPPGPALQANPRIEIDEYRRWEESILTQYGWIDSQNAIVRIPIDRAMGLVAERGLPHREEDER